MNANKFLHSAIAAFACTWATAILTPSALAGGDIFDGYIQINGTWYNIGGVNDGRNNPSGSANQSTRTLLSNVDFGTQTFGSFNITGFQIYGWTSFGTSVANNGANYKVWRSGDSEPSYSNFWDTTSETYYSGGDYTSSATGQSTALIGDTFINGATYNLKIQTFTVLTGDNAGSKFYERSDSFVVNGARQLITGSGNTNQASVYNTSTNGGLVKQGSGSLTLTKDNSSATTGQKGLIYIDEGTVAVNPDAGVSGNNSLGGSSVEVRLGAEGGSTTAKFALADGDGGLSVSRNVVVRSGSSGTKTIGAENASGTNTLSGGIFLDDNVTLTAASGGTFNFSGKFEDGLGGGSYAITVGGSGRVLFSGSTNNTGITGYTVNNGATLVMDKSSADAVQSTLTINSGGTAEFAASNQLGSSAVVVNNGTLATGTGSITDTFGSLTNSGTISGNGTLTAESYTLSGGTVNANLGAGTLNITGSAALNGTSGAGTVAITGGNLTLGTGANRLSTNAEVTISLNRALNIASDQTLVSVRETGTGNGGTIAISNGATLTVTGANKGTLFQNSISGGGGLTVNASGTTSLSLYGTQSYTGATTVSGGKLSTGTALATANVTINGGTFETSAANILGDSIAVGLSSGTYSLGGNDTVGSFTISGGEISGANTLTAATYALNGGTVTANLGAGAATAASGTTALNGNLGGSLTANGGTVNAGGTIGGNVTVGGGTVNLGASDRIANGAAVSITSGTLGMSTFNDTVGSFSISGGALGGSGTLTAATYALNGGTVTANLGAGAATAASGTTALNGNLGGSLTANGGTVNAGGTIGGNVTLAGGTVNLTANNRLADAATVTVSSGELGMGTRTDTITTLNVSGGSVTGSSGNKLTAGTYNLTGGTVGANLGAGTLNANSGSATLNGTADATTVNVGGGALTLGAANRLATSSAAVTVSNSGTLTLGGNETVASLAGSGGTLALGANTLTVGSGNFGSVISGIGGVLTKVGSGTLTLSGVNTYSGGTFLNGGTLDADNGSAFGTGSVTVGSGTILDLLSHNVANLIINNGGTILSTGTLSDVIATNGTTDIGGSNSVIEQVGGTAVVNVTGSSVVVSNATGGTLNADGTGVQVASVSGGTVNLGGSSAVVTAASAGTVNANASGATLGTVSGTAAVNVAGSNGRVGTLSGGSVAANAAGLVITNKTGGNVAVSNGVTVALRSGNSAGVISGAGGIAKQGSTTLTLSGVNTYTGATSVEQGRLVVAGGGSLSSTNTTVSGAGSALTVDGTISGVVTASSGGSIGGSGTVGTLNILGGGILGPGNSPGITTATNGASWANSGVYDWEIFSLTDAPGTGWDLLQVTGGSLDLTGITTAGGFTINLISLSGLNTQGALAGFSPTATYTNWLIASAPTISGFSAGNISLNSSLFVGATGTFGIEQRAYGGGQGLFVTYSGSGAPIPEPGTWAAAALLAGAAGYVRWRRRKQSEPKA